MIEFVLLAAVMLAAALAFVLPTLLGGRRGATTATLRRRLDALEAARTAGVLSEAEYAAKRAELAERSLDVLADTATRRSSRAFAAAGWVALLLPVAAITLYRLVGEPAALRANGDQPATPAEHGENLEQAIAKLAERLKQQPDDVEGWTLLGRAYEATERFAEARDALQRAHDLAPTDVDVTVAYAEALALASPNRRIEGESRSLLDAALAVVPTHQRGLWLLGISEYQAKRYDAAIAAWNRLLAVLPQDAAVTAAVRDEIARAEAERDGRPEPAAAIAETSARDAPAEHAVKLIVSVSLAAKLKDRLAPDATLFVFAKAASGPPMPLAIQRLPARQLPTTVTLSDGMAMVPTLKLSQFRRVIVGARVSRSGNAIAQSGDLQAFSPPLDVTTTKPIELVIDQVVP
jgi:cytochrome c-type biogenesis protein CcmH